MKGLKITTALERLVQMYEIIYIGTGGLGLNICDHRKDFFFVCYYVRRRGLPIQDVRCSIITTGF